MESAPSIFVQIASYRDPECQWTVWDLFAKADRPNRINVGICWQCDPLLDRECFTAPSPRPAQTKIISVLPSETEGVCWARAQAQSLYAGEDYVLMIDSHMRFIKGWDTAMIRELWRCPASKPFLSNYPPGYKPPDALESNPKFIVLRAKPFDENGDIRFTGDYLPQYPSHPLQGAFLAAGFLVAPGKFLKEVPYDPYMYFDHEEVTLAARAYTHGWDVFHPSKTFIYHYYPEPAKGEKRALHWTDYKDWGKYLVRSRARYNYLLAGIEPDNREHLKDIEKYGLGSERTLQDFEEFSGLDFKNKTASDKALRAGFIKDLDRYRGKRAEKMLATGDALPTFELLDAFGKKQAARALAGAGNCLFCVLPGSFDAFVQEFVALYHRHEAELKMLGVHVIFVAPVQLGELKTFRRKYEIGQPIYADESHSFHHAFGVEEKVVFETPLTFGVNGALKISNAYTNRNAQNHINDLLREARIVAPRDQAAASQPSS